MSVVHEGVPNGEKIMQLFGGDAKKKVFLYWSPGNEVIGMSKMDQRLPYNQAEQTHLMCLTRNHSGKPHGNPSSTSLAKMISSFFYNNEI